MVDLQTGEGAVSVTQFREPEEAEVQEAEVQETEVEETEVEEEVEESGEAEESEEVVDEEEATTEEAEEEFYTKDELVEAMSFMEQKLRKEYEQATRQPAREEQPEPRTEEEKVNLLDAALEEVLGKVADDQVLTGEDFKALMKQTFSTLNQKSQEYQQSEEVQYFDGAIQHYMKEYIPKIVAHHKLTPGSRDARFVANSFLETAIAAQQKFGSSQKAAQAAANQHMMMMRKEFGEPTKPIPAKKLPIEKKMAAGNTGSEPTKPKITTDMKAVGDRIESGKASISEILRMVNTKK